MTNPLLLPEGKPLDCIGIPSSAQVGKHDFRLYQPPEDHPDLNEHRRRFIELIEGERLKIAPETRSR